MLRSWGLDTEMMMWAPSHLRAATMRIPRSGAEQKIGPAWGEAAWPAGEHQQILRARITTSSQPGPWHSICILRQFLVLPSLRQNVTGYIYLRKIAETSKQKQNHFCVLSVSYSETQLLMVSSQCLPKNEMIICLGLFLLFEDIFCLSWHEHDIGDSHQKDKCYIKETHRNEIYINIFPKHRLCYLLRGLFKAGVLSFKKWE